MCNVHRQVNPVSPTSQETTNAVISCAEYKTIPFCAENCVNTDMRSMSSTTNSSIVDGANAAINTQTVFTNDVQPLLRCSFLSDIFEAIYVPFCINTPKGFLFITMSNGGGCFTMVLMFITGVMLTKKLHPDYTGDSDGATKDSERLSSDDDVANYGPTTSYKGPSA